MSFAARDVRSITFLPVAFFAGRAQPDTITSFYIIVSLTGTAPDPGPGRRWAGPPQYRRRSSLRPLLLPRLPLLPLSLLLEDPRRAPTGRFLGGGEGGTTTRRGRLAVTPLLFEHAKYFFFSSTGPFKLLSPFSDSPLMRGCGGSAPNRSLTSAAAAAAAAASSPASAEPRLSPRSRDRFAALCWWWCPPLRSFSLLEPGLEAEVEGGPAAERLMLGNLFCGQGMYAHGVFSLLHFVCKKYSPT